ncbi:MAG: YccF domain-containing protein [Clostridia bacterium]|nr:YccF domain-containing protein [Clostridia bacterium]
MKVLGNIVWFLCGGFVAALAWWLSGLLCCITVVGIPLGKQCFKFARLSLAPFGKEVDFGGGAPSLIANILWIVLLGWENALYCVAMGVLCCCTIVLIPIGLQYFKFAKLAFMPFGTTVR